MRKLVSLFLCLLMLIPFGAQAEENMLVNGDFASLDESGWPAGWAKDAWLRDEGVTYWSVSDDGPEGRACAQIENVASNDARFIQEVAVEPETVYHLSALVRAEGIPEDAGGAGLSVLQSYADFPQVWDTDGEFVLVESWIKTDMDQRSLVVAARLGDYSADNTGRAWFADVRMERADAVPDGELLILLTDYSQYQNDGGAEEIAAETEKTEAILPWALLFALAAAALWLLRGMQVSRPKLMIALLMALALILRVLLAVRYTGYETDNNCFYAWALAMANAGPNAFYDSVSFCDYPPGYLYLLWPVGALMNLLGVANVSSAAVRVLLRLTPSLCDVGAVYLLWKLGRRRLGETAAWLLAALYAVSPAVLIDSAVWGQVDGVLVLGLLLTVYFAQEDNWTAALPVFVVTALMKPQALMAAPLGLLALVMRKGQLKKALRGLAIALGAAAAMLLPFAWGKPVTWIFELYTSTLGSYPYATLNAANFYYLIGANWTPLTAKFLGVSYGAFGTAMTVLAVAGTLLLYWKRSKHADLALCGAACYMLLFLFGVKMHERYLFPALALLAMAYIRRRDARLLYAFAGYSLTFYFNCALVLRDTHLSLGFGGPGAALAAANLLLCALVLWTALDDRTMPLPQIKRRRGSPGESNPFAAETVPVPKPKKRETFALLALTAVYACVAFIGLGSTKAPQTVWSSTGAAESVTFDLGESRKFYVLYYGEISTRNFTLEFSGNGENWTDPHPAKRDAVECFRWQYVTGAVRDAQGDVSSWTDQRVLFSGRYVRLTANGPAVNIMEIVFRTEDGEVLPVAAVESSGGREENASDPHLLCDEPETVCDEPSYYNGTYFDEIYHARTGYELAHGMSIYEWTHPPLGKIFIMLGIKLFGMTPFGWRFFGALTGVLMIPAIYALALVVLRKQRWAFLTAFVMAFDMMHLTQTRIATIDSYAVFFIMLMFLFMFRYLQMNLLRDRYKTLIPLALSGLFMGIGWACKWICLYSSVGLALLFFYSFFRHIAQWRWCVQQGGEAAERARGFWKMMGVTIAVCFLVFIFIPFAIYYFSYIPHFRWEGGLTWKRFWDTQVSMFNYHSGLSGDDHAFKSPWYEWPLILKPMYYYKGKPYVKPGSVASIMCMGNPAVWWVGLGTLLYTIFRAAKNLWNHKTAADPAPALIVMGFAAQYLPWVLVPRSMFIYHYFGSLPFVMISIAYAFSLLEDRNALRAWNWELFYCTVTVCLFAAFYPIATGVQFPEWWANAINWFSFLKLPGWKYRGWLYY